MALVELSDGPSNGAGVSLGNRAVWLRKHSLVPLVEEEWLGCTVRWRGYKINKIGKKGEKRLWDDSCDSHLHFISLFIYMQNENLDYDLITT